MLKITTLFPALALLITIAALPAPATARLHQASDTLASTSQATALDMVAAKPRPKPKPKPRCKWVNGVLVCSF